VFISASADLPAKDVGVELAAVPGLSPRTDMNDPVPLILSTFGRE
jgi:hypothetical protein